MVEAPLNLDLCFNFITFLRVLNCIIHCQRMGTPKEGPIGTSTSIEDVQAMAAVVSVDRGVFCWGISQSTASTAAPLWASHRTSSEGHLKREVL